MSQFEWINPLYLRKLMKSASSNMLRLIEEYRKDAAAFYLLLSLSMVTHVAMK